MIEYDVLAIEVRFPVFENTISLKPHTCYVINFTQQMGCRRQN